MTTAYMTKSGRPPPYVLGLTGSIGSGKSTLSGYFRRLGGMVSASDEHVAALYGASDPLMDLIHAYDDSVFEGGVLRKDRVRDHLLGDPRFRYRLEKFIHPRVRAAHQGCVQEARKRGIPLIVLDIPLLFEAAMDDLCDGVLLLCCPTALRRERVLKRPGMTATLFHQINSLQMCDDEKKKRASFLIDSSGRPLDTWRRAQQTLDFLCQRSTLLKQHKD